MTIQEAIEVLKTNSCTDCTWGCDSPISCEYEECEVVYATNKAIEALEEQDKHRWIPVSERLPEDESKEYMCCNGKCHMRLLWFSKDLYNFDEYDFARYKGMHKQGFVEDSSEYGYYFIDDIVAWMPLPEPYKQD